MRPVTDPALLELLEGGAPSELQQAMGLPPAAQAQGARPGLRAVADPALLAELEGQAPVIATVRAPDQAEPEYRVSDEMSLGGRLLAGYGRGVTELGQGIKQLGLHAGEKIGLVDPQTVADYDRHVADEAALWHGDLGDSWSGKIGNFTGQMVTTAPVGAAGIIGRGSLAARGILPSAGMSAGQGAVAGALQPVESGDPGTFWSDKGVQTTVGGAFGAGTNLGLRGAGGLIERLMPSNIPKQAQNASARLMNRINKKANASDFAAEGERLAQATGVGLTPAQVSGSKAGNMLENAARQSFHSRDLAFQGDAARIQQLADHFDNVIARVSSQEVSPALAGQQVQTATRKLVRSLEDWRSKVASEDYGRLREMVKDAGPIEPKATHALLTEIAAEAEGVGTPGADALARFARKQLANTNPAARDALTDIDKAVLSHFGGTKNLTGDALAAAERMSPGIGERLRAGAGISAPAQGSLEKLFELRSYLSKVSSGQAKISGENQDRRLAARLLQTIDEDLETAGEQIGGDVGKMLKLANARYRELSKQIDSVKGSPLGKALGEDFAGALQTGEFNSLAPEKIFERVSRLKPTELGVVRGLLEKDQPKAWKTLRAAVLQDAVEKAKQMPATAGANTPVLRPSMLVKNLEDRKRLKALFDEDELKQIYDGLDVARRLSDMTGFNTSGTAGMAELLKFVNSPLGAAAHLVAEPISGGTRLATEGMGSRAIARIMNSADGRRGLIELERLQKLPRGAAKAREVAAYLAALAAEPDTHEPGE